MAMDSVDLTLDDGWLDPLQARSSGGRKKGNIPEASGKSLENHGLIWFNGDKWWLVYGLMVINGD